MTASQPRHRGRLQAQGGGVEESEAWARTTPLSATEAHKMLHALHSKLSPREQTYRDQAFKDAHKFINNAACCNGVRAQIRKSYPMPPRPDHRRVDIEVIAGEAFVP